MRRTYPVWGSNTRDDASNTACIQMQVEAGMGIVGEVPLGQLCVGTI